MHDCPNCRVPLHGHEETCPSCGARQYVRQGFSADRFAGQPEPKVNLVPIVITIIAFGFIFFFAIQFSWVGQVINQKPVPESPIEKMTYTDARQSVVNGITQNLAQVGAKGKFTWTSQGSPVDPNANQQVELDVQTRLQNKDQRKAIIDPIKDYLAQAKITTLTMSDTRSGAVWTYSVSTPAVAPEPDAGALLGSPDQQTQQAPSQDQSPNQDQ
jgi:hypothetical protein